MQHPQAHTDVTIWHKGISIPELEQGPGPQLPALFPPGMARPVSLDQPNLYPVRADYGHQGDLRARGSICPIGSHQDDQAPWPACDL